MLAIITSNSVHGASPAAGQCLIGFGYETISGRVRCLLLGSLLMLGLWLAPPTLVGAEDSSLSETQKWFALQLEPHLRAYTQLNEGYVNALGRLLDEQTRSANLAAAIQVRKEIEAFGDGRHFNDKAFRERLVDGFAPLRNLQNTYLVTHAKITADVRSPLTTTLAEFDQRLAKLQDSLTRDAKLDVAQHVSTIRDEIKAEPAAIIEATLNATEQGTALLGLVFFGVPTAAADEMSGNLLLVAKGQVEVFINGRKAVVRNQASHKEHFQTKVPERTYKVGDAIVLQIRSPVVYRAITAAINRSGKAGQVTVKNADWRFLGERSDGNKISAEDIKASNTMLAKGTPDEYGVKDRDGLGILPESQGGSAWVKTPEQLNGWYCVGFVITSEMVKPQ
jgi:hypothetical protein